VVPATAVQHLDLDAPLPTSEHVIYAPAGDLSSVSDASLFGVISRLARVAVAPFGVESDRLEPRASTGLPVAPHSLAAATLREALDAICRVDPRYTWKDVNGVIVVRARDAWNDANDPLNRRVGNVRLHDLTSFTAFDAVAHLLYPGEQREYFAGLRAPTGRSIDIDVPDGTIADVLNAVTRSDGELGWWVRYGGPTDDRRFELTIGHYGIGPAAHWSPLP